MPQVCQVSQRRFLCSRIIHPDSEACRPLIPNHVVHRFRCLGKSGRHAPEQVVGMLWNEWTASIGIDGRHGPDYAFALLIDAHNGQNGHLLSFV